MLHRTASILGTDMQACASGQMDTDIPNQFPPTISPQCIISLYVLPIVTELEILTQLWQRSWASALTR